MTTPLLQTKLYIPSTRPDLVPRPRLIERLNEGLHRKLTLISAPAGFGKTTLVSEWVAGCKQPVAWLSLDDGDNDLNHFLAYLVAALQTLVLSEIEGIASKLGEEMLEILQSPPPLPTEPILTGLLNEITAVPNPFLVVLDDYHLIDAKPVDQALTFLLERLPSQMHLVIATREDPNLPLARLRVRDQLTELRAADLRFTLVEAALFLNQAMNLNLSAEDIAVLETRTEGWIAGLQLAALSMQGHQDAPSFIKSFSGSHHFVLDYLVEEVLQQQPASVQTFLLHTSILDRFCSPLCDVVLNDPSVSSQETLAYIDQANLFIVPLDNERRWYRYHHLFADLLQARLRKEPSHQIRSLHRRASGWYEQHNFRSDAIHHALAAEDFERAADLIELDWLANSGTYFQNVTWTEWVQALPDALVRSRMTLSLGYAWQLLFLGQLQAAKERLKDADRLSESMVKASHSLEVGSSHKDEKTFDTQQGLLAVAWAFHAQALSDNAGTIKHARQALNLLSETNHYVAGSASALLGLAYWANGDLETAVTYMSTAINRLRTTGHFLFAISGAHTLAGLRIAQGRLFDAINLYKETLQFATAQGEPVLPGTADLHLGLSSLYREQGNDEAAKGQLQKGEALGKQAALPEWPYGLYLVQAQFKVDQGELDDALRLLEAAERLYRSGPVPNVRPVAALKTQVWLRQGRLAEALHWVRRRGLSIEDDISYLHEFEYITLARTLIARYEIDQAEQAIHEAVGLLSRLLKTAEDGERNGSVIEILVLQALAHQVQGNTPLALTPLEQALTLAEPEGYVRVFVNEGMPMAELLRATASQGIRPDYTDKLLAAFGIEAQRRSDQTDPAPTQSPAPRPQSIIEPLTERELEILSLIAAGKKNQEIADQLIISLNTVRYHTKNLYGKLGVNKRTQAVARAQELGLI